MDKDEIELLRIIGRLEQSAFVAAQAAVRDEVVDDIYLNRSLHMFQLAVILRAFLPQKEEL